MASGTTASVKVVLDEKKMMRAIFLNDNLGDIVKQHTDTITDTANSLASGYQTGLWHDHSTGETRGHTFARFAGDVMRGRYTFYGIVYAANYSAQKNNFENNTLLKAMR